ncbi:MAG: PHP-associated domain-containing protein [Candidatus Hodarchaeota archaeon]
MNPRLSAFDMHTHTYYSKDGLNHPKSLFKLMKRKGLRGVALTEHWQPSIFKPIKNDDRFLINGCEYKSSDYGELIGLFITEPIENRSFEEIADDIHDQNGITILPHPRDPARKHTAVRKGLPNGVMKKHVDLIEGINSRCLIPIFNTWAQKLAKKLGKPMTAGSDGHMGVEIGNGLTWLQDIETPDDIYEELRSGRTQITGHSSVFAVHIPSALWQRLRKWPL